MFGYKASELQSEVAVKNGVLYGTLNYIDGTKWDPGTWGSDMDTGNYIALHCFVPDVEGVTIKVTLNIESTLDEDGLVVGHISDKNSQTVKVVASKEGYASVTKIYSLKGLICEEEPEDEG